MKLPSDIDHANLRINTVADVDLDNDIDIIFLYQNEGGELISGTPLQSSIKPIVMTGGDIDGDGYEDIIFAALKNRASPYLNTKSLLPCYTKSPYIMSNNLSRRNECSSFQQ